MFSLRFGDGAFSSVSRGGGRACVYLCLSGGVCMRCKNLQPTKIKESAVIGRWAYHLSGLRRAINQKEE